MSVPSVLAWAVEGIPEIVAGADLTSVISDAIVSSPRDQALSAGDIVVVTSKIVSKAEGRFVKASDREAAIRDQTARVVASKTVDGGITQIVENHLGIVGAAAGVDASNTPEGTVLLLPVDPDESARAICKGLRDRFQIDVGVIVSDTLGRPWRIGQTDIAIGAAGVFVTEDMRGASDTQGRALNVTQPAVADEIAAFTDLVKGKSNGLPVAVVRGLGRLVTSLDAPGARSLVRGGSDDMFRLGTDEALSEGYARGLADGLAAQ